MKSNHPEITESILNAIGQLTTSALELILSAEFDNNALERLGTLIRVNHGYLVSLGVSHPRLERIRELVDYADIGWTKLTGAGGGGCAITLFRPDVNGETIKELERKLSMEGFNFYKTILGTEGVGVLWPAVFQNSINRQGGKEIDQEIFENAAGDQGIEQLVGVGELENQGAWKFWSRAVVSR